MNSVQRQSFVSRLVAWVTVLSLVVNAVVPAAGLLAQDEPQPLFGPTETPAAPPALADETAPLVEPPTDAPAAPTDEPATETPTDTPVDPTEEPATPAPVVTEAPTAAPTPLPADVIFLDDFQDGDASGWQLSPGWQLAVEGDNWLLTASAPSETAVIDGLTLGDLALSVRVRVAPGGQAVVALRAGEAGRYALTLDMNGSVSLWRHDTLLAQGPAVPELPADALPPWRTVNVQMAGGSLTASVDGVPVIVTEDVAPLPPGWVALETGSSSAGAVSFDQILIRMPDTAALPTVLPTEPPLTPELPTPAPIVTDEPAVAPAPVEPPASEPEPEGVLVLSADFEGEPTGWLPSADASIVVEAGNNHALLLPAGGSLLPAETLVLGDFRLEARVMLLADGGLNLPFRTLDGRGYGLSLSAAQAALLRNDGEGAAPIASLPAARALNTWHTLALEARGGALVVSVNGVPELTVEQADALAAGQLALLAAGTLMLDDVRVFDLTPIEALAAAAPTPAPFTLSDAEIARLPGGMDIILNRYLSGDEAGALSLARSYFLPLDDEGRVLVTIWASDGADGATLAALVTQVGGAADYTYDTSVEARLPLAAFLPLANAPQVAGMRFAALATSTSSAGAPTSQSIASYSGTPTEGYDILGVNDWHLAGFTGGGTNIAVIDTGFADIATIPAAELPTTCLPSRTVNNAPSLSGVGSSNHGTKVAQVLCDLAPNARLTLYRAETASQLANRVSAASSAGNHIILITMDLGANVSPGDGTGGSNPDAVSLYTNIQNARNAGRLVIVSAGNNFGRYVSFTYGGGTTNIQITAQPGDRVNVSWNDWDTTAPNVDLTMSLTGALPYGGRGSGTPSHQFIVLTANPTLSITGVSGVASVYVQVQVTGAGEVGTPTGGTISNVNTTSSLGRPADSPHALTVGAVCARQQLANVSNPTEKLTYPLLEDSSRGPIFSAGGGAPSAGPFATRTAFKPDLVGPSNVTTTYAVADPNSCASDGTVFSGTSAAAANVAAMAALIRSNNTAFLSPYVGTPQGLINYMQAHSLDLYLGALPDGYDMAHGAGLAMLGSPRPEAALTAAAADVNPMCRYVNPYSEPNFTASNYGTFANPFVHVAPAINAAGAGGCVILFPGEYVSGIGITSALPQQVRVQSYDSAANGGRLSASTPDSIFWVNNTYKGVAGIAIEGNNPVIDGLVFRSANPLQPGALNVQFDRPNAVTVYDASLTPGAIIQNSVFTGFRGRPPVIIGGNAENVTVQGSTFSSNDSRGGAAITISSSTAILVQRNTFTGNNSTELGADISEPVVQITESVVNLYNNRFVANGARSALRVRNTGDPVGEGAGAKEIQVFGNLFQDNTGAGPLIHLRPSRRFYFVNNTVVGNTGMDDPVYGLIIARGDSDGNNGDGGWEIHNNLFYSNSPTAGIISDIAIVTTCKRIGVPGSDDGAQYNWYAFSGDISGECQNSLGPTVNGNVTLDPKPITDPNSQFVGPTVSPNDPYQLKGVSTAGVDAGNQSLLTAAMLASGDLLGRPRVENGQIDIGAYEFVTVRGQDGDLNFAEDALSVNYNLSVTGGFPPYTYQIITPPAIYDVNPGNLCGGQPLKVNAATGQVTYCPPKNYYTIGAPTAAQASFTYRVVDAGGNISPAPNTITLRGTGAADPALTQPLTQRVQVGAATAPAPTVIQFRIRPYVSFDDNFLFSEDGGPEDTLGAGGAPAQNRTPGADYPYTYSYVSGSLSGDYVALGIGEGDITTALAAASNPVTNSLVTLNANGGTTGTFSFQYTVGSSSVQHTVEVTVRGSLPYTGLHDDTSFVFDYTGSGWTPIYSEPNINNTLHRTTTSGDRADFSFVGTGFALYMQASSAGGWWELQVDGLPLTWDGRQTATRGSLICRTSSTTGVKSSTTDFSKFISGRGTTAYIVSCARLRAGEAHMVSIINREARQLNVDAIGILTDSTVLLPGKHYVNESQVLPLFFGWTLFSDRSAANGSAVSTTNTNIADVQFSFKGSGLAIGTTLERNRTTGQGAQYRICVAPEAVPTNTVCQDFNNAVGAGTSPVWGVFRPFFGFDPSVEHIATLDVLSIPAGARLVIDSIVVLDAAPTAALPFGTTEDDVRGPIITLGGRDDSWLLDTNNARASNGSLTTIARGVNNAGPFISFRVPAAADAIYWFRQPGSADSQQVLVCVNRARGDAPGDQAKHCIQRDLRAANSNPLVIRRSDFASATWGPAWRWAGESVDTHFVEIFSLVNQPFNLDSIQVINSARALDPSYYEQNVAGLQYFDQAYNLIMPYPGAACPTTNVTPPTFCEPRANTRYSNNTQINVNKALAGMAFRFTGTGFAPSFTSDAASGPVKVCWLRDGAVPPAAIDSTLIQNVVNTGRCLTFDNNSRSAIYRASRSILGLQPGTYTAVVQHAGADRVYNAALRRYEGHTMQFDALEIFGVNWDGLAPVTLQDPPVRVETSYANRLADNRFQYFGAGWRSVTGAAARSYSGQNYDQARAVGAGVVLRTNGGDILRIYRDVRAGYAPLQVCWMPEDDFDPFQCAILRNDGGTGVSAPFQVQLSSSGAHVVSITALTNGIFNLDAVELLSSAQPLTAGVYPESDPRLIYTPVADAVNGWRDVFGSNYLDRSAYQTTTANAQVQFRFTGTGFSLFTLFEPAAGSLIIEVDGMVTGNDYQVVNTTSANSRVYYGMAHSVTGLPFDTYTVTVRQPDAKRFTVDGVEIYGDYPAAAMPLGIFDDTAVDASGRPYLRFGPGNAAWTTRSGSAASAYLNQTHRLTNHIGAQVNFAVDDANAITLHHSGSTTTSVQVCASLTIPPYTRTCLPPQSLAPNKNTTFVFNPTTPGDYFVSVTNLTAGVNFYVDAIGVHDTSGAGALKAGVYQENHPQLAPRFGAGWLPAAASAGATDGLARATNTASGSQTLEFTFTGTGFSIVLAESTATSPQYSLCVEVASNSGSCDMMPLTTLTNAATSAARAPFALTYVGFSPGTYTVRLANADPGPTFTRPLVVDRVDILNGVPEQIGSAVTGNVENTDRRIVYFPYFSFNEALAAAASGGSQHLGSMRGSVAYFELNGFAGTNIEYVRQTLAAYGLVNVCSAAIGTNSAVCTTPAVINNAAAPLGFRQSALPAPAVGAGTRWVFLRNADGKPMPVDFVRPVFTTTPALTAGFYEDDHPGLDFSSGAFTETPVAGASGGTVRLTTTVNDALRFEFNGTGFAAFFTLDPRADAVRICWRAGLGWTVAQTQDTVNGAVCRTYDNESSAVRYQAARTIAGLLQGNYTASVQMLPDNNSPLPHTPANTPITMQIDAVQIFNDAPLANVLNTPGQRYETSFANRAADGRFLYYGNGWRSVSGTSARAYSGQNYDTISNVIGAGVVFRTNNANAIILYRDMRPGHAPLEVCAAPAAAPTQWFCTPVANTATTGSQQPVRVFLNNPSVPGSGPGQSDDTAEHIVSIMTVGAGPVFLDAVEVVNTTQALPPGLYEDVHPALGYDADWVEVYSPNYSGRRARQTNVVNAQLAFRITGATGFEVGMVQDVFGGDVEVCYADNAAFTGQACYTYTNQATRTSYLSSRVVAGLTAGNYWVRVRNVDDGVPPRDPRYAPARLVVDYVRVLGDALPPIVTQPGLYNEDARDGSGQPYLGLVPAERWSAFAGTAARGYSGGSYVGVVDNARRISSTYAGPAAVLRLQVPAGGATVILYTGPAASTNTLQLLVCANRVAVPSGTDCTVITNLNTANQVVLNGANLPALGSAAADVRLTFRALTPGFFRIDGFQVVHGTMLTPGIYDDFLVSNGGLLDSTGPAAWATGQKNARAYGGTQARSPLSTAGRGAKLAFTFNGTGFSLLTQVATTGVDFRVCYRRATGSGNFPTHSDPLNQDGDLQAGDVICRTLTTNTTAADWATRNAGRLRPTSANQYGFAFYGLPEDEYRVEVVHVDGTVTSSSALFVDGVVVFGQVPNTQRLEPGQVYDDTASQIGYAPDAFWTPGTARFGPARGPWQKTEHTAINAGTLAQLAVNGNALVVYQTASAANSRSVWFCLVTPQGLECTDYSQSAATTYFTPVAFYGFGPSTPANPHRVIIENRDAGKKLSLDALQVLR